MFIITKAVNTTHPLRVPRLMFASVLEDSPIPTTRIHIHDQIFSIPIYHLFHNWRLPSSIHILVKNSIYIEALVQSWSELILNRRQGPEITHTQKKNLFATTHWQEIQRSSTKGFPAQVDYILARLGARASVLIGATRGFGSRWLAVIQVRTTSISSRLCVRISTIIGHDGLWMFEMYSRRLKMTLASLTDT